MPADGLAPDGARPSAGTVLIVFGVNGLGQYISLDHYGIDIKICSDKYHEKIFMKNFLNRSFIEYSHDSS